MKIGDVKLKSRLILAPMANITDPAFRILCNRHGCGLTYTEMVNANALVRANKATLRKAQFSDEDRPVTGQIFGAKIDIIKKAVPIMAEDSDIVDINMGCPDKDVMKIGAGSSLLVKPTKIGEIIKAMKSSTDKPVTAKIRIGLDSNHINAIRNAKIIEESGADAIAIHGRTTAQGYSGLANWDIIQQIKDELSIPVIGNGDIKHYVEAEKRLKITDLVMIGRGATGNPQIFNGGKIDQSNQSKLFLEYLKIAKNHYIHFEQKKRQSMWFMQQFDGASELRKRLSQVKSEDEIIDILK